MTTKKTKIVNFFILLIIVVMSWRSVEDLSKNDELQPPTGSNIRKQANYAVKLLMKCFGGDQNQTRDFVVEKFNLVNANDTMVLNQVGENLEHLSSKMNPWNHYNVTKFNGLSRNFLQLFFNF